jgi:hypothetical protein
VCTEAEAVVRAVVADFFLDVPLLGQFCLALQLLTSRVRIRTAGFMDFVHRPEL